MSKQQYKRREFLETLGLGAASLGAALSAPHVLGHSRRGLLVESPSEYSDFLVEKITDGSYPYRINPDVLQPMSEKYNIFSRNVWDPVRRESLAAQEDIAYLNLVEGKGIVPNQTRLDYAFMAAAWHSSRSDSGSAYKWHVEPRMVRGIGLDKMGLWDPAELDMTWKEATLAVKHAALFYGASLAGISELNPLWLYNDHFSPTRQNRDRAIPVHRDGERYEKTDEAWFIPRSLNRVIVLGFEEDYAAIANSPGRLASAATGNGYSRMAVTSATLAEFIRGLGYRALPAGNGVGLSIPMAIDAGLGQLGRMGLLVTPKYGPRVRLAKVITDMPLVPDSPINFGVKEFCDACMLCAEHCPSGAVSEGHQTWEGKSPSNNNGTLKWYVEVEKCYDFNGFSCSSCKRVCPFNKPNNSWLHRLTRLVVKGKMPALDRLMVSLDQGSGYGEQLSDKEFWQRDGRKSITGRESM